MNSFLRRERALRVREEAALLAHDRPHPDQISNSDENKYPNFIGNYHKGLRHDAGSGEVVRQDYVALLAALNGGSHQSFESLPGTGVQLLRPLVNPQAGLAYDLEGPDAGAVTMPPAPAVDSAQTAGEAVELYWMALLRDVDFRDYAANADVATAAGELGGLTDFRGPRQGGNVTAQTLFRGSTPGDIVGPYVSQFLLLDIPYGTLTINQRQFRAKAGVDYMKTWGDWLEVQNGEGQGTAGADTFEPDARYIRTGRDLATYVHFDELYEAYLNACLILLSTGAPFDAGIPYGSGGRQTGFGTFGGPHILSLVTEVATRALKAVWHQKWLVHRRLRPEAYGGLVERVKNGAEYPLHADILNSEAADRVNTQHNSYLLPMAFPEGSPLHPAYGAGHATVAAACTTILKAWFDESFLIRDLNNYTAPGKHQGTIGSPKIPTTDGLGLENYTGADAALLTVGGELNKVAANVAIGRNFGGVHWFSDYTGSIVLGEEVAIRILQEQKSTYNELGFFTLTKFDGTQMTI
jgi:membrane-associated phospholipid phosphatase